MSKKLDRSAITSEICNAAQLYKKQLVGKTFLYVFEGQHIEVIYKAANFKHLTGVESSLTAKRFYSDAANRILRPNQIWFSPVHPYSLCKRKLRHIKDIATLAGAETFMLEEVATNSKVYKFGTTDLNFSLLLDHEYDSNGVKKSEIYIVESLRDEDCFSKSKAAYTISHIFSKQNDAAQYSKMLFMDHEYTLEGVPDDVKSMLDQSLLMKNE